MKDKAKRSYVIKTVANALDVLEQFNEGPPELGITELGQRLNLHKNKVFRILATLENRNYIEQTKFGDNYRLGIKTLDLRQILLEQMGLLSHSRPVLEDLKRDCNETSYVSIMRDFVIVNLDAVETDLPVRAVPRIGTRLPFHCSVAGKVLAAHVKTKELQECLNREALKGYTNNTIVHPAELERHLRRVARQGYAIDNEEFDADVKGVAAPIRDYRKMVVGAVHVSGPSFRFSDERIEAELVPRVTRAAAEISLRLGLSLLGC